MSKFVMLSVARNQVGQWDKGLFKTVLHQKLRLRCVPNANKKETNNVKLTCQM